MVDTTVRPLPARVHSASITFCAWKASRPASRQALNDRYAEIRQNVANLGVFVLNQTLTVMGNPKPERLSSLININREVAAGLRASAAAAP